MIARKLPAVLFVTIFMGCASQTLQLPISTNDPANPNAPESAFSPRPNLLQTETPVTTEQPVTEPTPLTHPPTAYACPMHPEAVQSGPGKCPKCGMRLVPSEPSKTDPEGKQ